MSSVAVVWKGNCREPRTRYRLLGHLHRLAQRSDEYLRLHQPERPRFLNLVHEGRDEAVRTRCNIESVDREISGAILVSSLVGADPDKLAASAQESGADIIEDPDVKGGALIAIKQARLRGIDFKLFDPRGLYPGADRMSFVFLECPQHPVLDGRLVEIATAEDCAARGSAALGGADLYLCAPSLHLRYYLEDWTDCLFSWIKFFFVGDFWWHRWAELQGYTDYRQVFEDLQTDRGGENAEQAAFDAVLATFSQHAEHWIGEVEGWAKSEQG